MVELKSSSLWNEENYKKQRMLKLYNRKELLRPIKTSKLVLLPKCKKKQTDKKVQIPSQYLFAKYILVYVNLSVRKLDLFYFRTSVKCLLL